jgi:hypothetical protein
MALTEKVKQRIDEEAILAYFNKIGVILGDSK